MGWTSLESAEVMRMESLEIPRAPPPRNPQENPPGIPRNPKEPPQEGGGVCYPDSPSLNVALQEVGFRFLGFFMLS